MGRRGKEVTSGLRKPVVAMIEGGIKQTIVADRLGIPKSTISDIWKRYVRRGNIENTHRCGRAPYLTDRDQRRLLKFVCGNRRKTLDEVTAELNDYRNTVNDVQVSSKTIDRNLKNQGYRRRVVKKTMVVREVNLRKRVTFCFDKRNLTVENYWKDVIFSDESQIVIGNDNRIFIWRRKDEAYRPACICPRSHRKLSVMIWGCITHHGVGTVCSVNGTINSLKYIEILEENLWPVLARHFANQNYIFQQDNAPVHKARVVSEYFTNHGIPVLEWPPQSPDPEISSKMCG